MYLASTPLLHIPDGFLSIFIAAISWFLAAIVVAIAVRRAQEQLNERLVPLAGIIAAFIFAGQMINFPVAGGTSGHLIGAALAAIVLGPWLGILVMTAVIALQGLLFQDGGLVVMGANILVMGVIPALIGYGLYRGVAERSRRLRLAVAMVAAWVSVLAAALITSLLLGFSGTLSFRIVVPAMLGVHAIIGVGEALITVAALSFILRARPMLLAQSAGSGSRSWVFAGIAATMLVVLLSPLASSLPDGLEWVAAEHGFLERAREAPFSVLPDYTIPGLGDAALSTVIAGLIGALLVALLIYATLRIVRGPRSRSREA
jgi:cobalt/nickel transport system permease protein